MANILKLKNSRRGLTLSELMIAALILVFALVGLLTLFTTCLFLNENSRNLTLAYSALEMRMEELSNENYLNLDSFNGEIFNLNGFSVGNGKGSIAVSDEMSGLKRITVKACFMSRNRLIGDNINNCQSSPVELVTLIAQP